MKIFLLILVLIWGYILSTTSATIWKNNIVGFILAFIFVFVASGFVTYTPDWDTYNNIIRSSLSQDFFFNNLVNEITPSNYRPIHMIFTGVYTFLLVLLVSRFSQRLFIIVLLYLPIIYITYTTQIRFYMGYFSIFIAFYLWYVTDKKKLAVALAFFAVINHWSIALFIPVIFLLYGDLKLFHKKVIYGFILLSIVYGLLNQIDAMIPQDFMIYIKSDKFDSSFLGGLFKFLPAIFVSFSIYLYNKIQRYSSFVRDKKFQYLYRFSIAPIIFLGISLDTPVIGSRFIIPSVLFQIMLLFYLSEYNSKKHNMKLTGCTLFFFVFYMVYIYVIPPLMLGNNNSLRAIRMLNSNTFFNYFW